MSSLAMVCVVILATGAEVCGEPMPTTKAVEIVETASRDQRARDEFRFYPKEVEE